MSNDKYYISIDCPPNSIRPDDVLSVVLNGSKLTRNNFSVISKTFGEWKFVLNNDCNPNDFIEYLPNIRPKLLQCLNDGKIRYAEWYDEDEDKN